VKKAFNQWCFPSDWSWQQVFMLCKETGTQGIELCIDYPPFFEAMAREPQEGLIAEIARSVGSSFQRSKALRFDSPEREVRDVARMASDHGVAVSSLLTIAQFHYSLVSDDPGLRATGIDLVRRLLDLAVLTGAPNLLIVPGVVTSRVGYEDAMRRLEEALGILAAEAAQRRVGLGLENVWGKLLYSPLEMRDLIDRIASPWVGVHFDVGNIVQHGYPDQWIRILGKRLRNVHLKDYVESINNIRAFTWLFQGSVAWDSVMRALRDSGYDGYLIAEVPPYPFCAEQGIRDTARRMDILLQLA
jgi:L-ribulose-5-phosphate 3-epimerase